MNSEVQQYAINFSHTIRMHELRASFFYISPPFITFRMIADNEKAERKEAHRIHIVMKLSKVFVTFMCFKKWGSLECQFFIENGEFMYFVEWKIEREVLRSKKC